MHEWAGFHLILHIFYKFSMEICILFCMKPHATDSPLCRCRKTKYTSKTLDTCKLCKALQIKWQMIYFFLFPISNPRTVLAFCYIQLQASVFSSGTLCGWPAQSQNLYSDLFTQVNNINYSQLPSKHYQDMAVYLMSTQPKIIDQESS